MAYCVARSPGVIDPSYPILGPFLAKSLELGLQNEHTLQFNYSKLKVQSSATVDRTCALHAIEHRYGIDHRTVLEIEKLIAEVSTLPVLICHPALLLLRADYE